MNGLVFTDPACLAYSSPGHPEAPERVARTAERLKQSGFEVLRPQPAPAEWVGFLHKPGHWDDVRTGAYRDPDTPVHDGIADIVLVSLGGAVAAMESAAAGRPAFSLMRPPGHHAGPRRVSGFCYVNNVALAVEKAVRDGRCRRPAIVDIDVHHGDGTQEFALQRPEWLFVSLHEVPLFPGTGLVSEKNCLNFPLTAGTDGTSYLEALDEALAKVGEFEPDLVAVSAGFDTFKRCPIANLALEEGDYKAIGLRLSRFARRFAVLEGGYAPELPGIIEQFLNGFFKL